MDFEVVGRAADGFAEKALRLGLGDGLFQDFGAERKLAADIDISEVNIVRVAGDDHAFKQLVRVLVNDLSVLECARLRFVGVADEVNRLGVLLGVDEAPLHPAGKSGTAPAAQLRRFHLGDDVGPRHRKRFFKVLVSAVTEIAVDIEGVTLAIDVGKNQAAFGDGHGKDQITKLTKF
jgi:hypothetical protein